MPIMISEALKKWGPALAIAGFFAILLTLAYCTGSDSGKSKEVAKQQERELETQRDLGNANDAAAEDRVEGAAKAGQQQRELNDALKATSDPDRQRALRGCAILRQQGRDTSSIPACR